MITTVYRAKYGRLKRMARTSARLNVTVENPGPFCVEGCLCPKLYPDMWGPAYVLESQTEAEADAEFLALVAENHWKPAKRLLWKK